MKINQQHCQITFALSAARIDQLPPDHGNEVAFIGRSNVGKSSALNAIANSKNLARVGKTPGVTQLINVFTIDHNKRLIDLPGYGYAKVSHQIRDNWHKLINKYLMERKSLAGLFLLIDIRHLFNESDIELLNWAHEADLPTCIILTKADKLSRQEIKNISENIQKELQPFGEQFTVVAFSAKSRLGLEQLTNILKHLLGT